LGSRVIFRDSKLRAVDGFNDFCWAMASIHNFVRVLGVSEFQSRLVVE
jgi:hypothetical protein